MNDFDFDRAFSRNLGWLTEQDQAVLRQKRVAIAGLGGVGGVHLLTLARLGIGAFTIADADTFELPNFNRQAGASMIHLDQKKASVMAALACDINPELDLRVFSEPIGENNVDEFLKDADLYLDGLDFFALEARRLIFRRCAGNDIPAVTAAPIGMGTALLNFLPGHMTFEDYFRFQGKDPREDLVRFVAGLSPRMLHTPYLVDDTRADFTAQSVPSTPIGCELSAGLAASHVLKILLQRGDVPAAPRGIHFDAYRNRMVRTWRPWGNANPIQKLTIALAKRKLISPKPVPQRTEDEPAPSTAAERVLQLARWAPSGDNLQQWRFTLTGENSFRIHGDNQSRDVYFLTPWPKMLALGALLETVAIAATGEGMAARMERPAGSSDSDREIIFDVTLTPEERPSKSPLFSFIRIRSTQRRSFSKTPLMPAHKMTLEQAAAPYRVLWLEEQKKALAHLCADYAEIRLTIPEAYEVHTKVIEWNSRYSRDRIPDQAIGLDPMALRLMRWALRKWSRVRFLNTYLAGTFLPKRQLDILPGKNAAGYVALLAQKPPRTIADFVDAGRAMQRFWLTAARLGLQFQPQMAPLIFDSYVREEIDFTQDRKALMKAKDLSPKLQRILGEENDRRVTFLGRIGFGIAPFSRSLRKPLSHLLVK